MANYTSEQLKKLFAERKRINEEKQQKIKTKLQQLNQILNKEYQKNYREKQKQLKQEAKYLKISKLQELVKKIAKKPQEYKNKTKEITTEYRVYRRPTRERYTNEDELYTKYELQHIEELYPNETGRINWDIWDKLVNKKLY